MKSSYGRTFILLYVVHKQWENPSLLFIVNFLSSADSTCTHSSKSNKYGKLHETHAIKLYFIKKSI